MVRPRLLIEVRAAIADLELKLDRWRTKHRKMIPPDAEDEARLARAGEILALLDDGAAS
jgi:hypothetical protein